MHYSAHQNMFIDQSSLAEAIRSKIIKRIHSHATTSQSQPKYIKNLHRLHSTRHPPRTHTPLHVSPFSSTKSNYSFPGQQVQRDGVNTLVR